MYELKKMESYLRVNLLAPGPSLIKKKLPGRGLTKVEKHWSTVSAILRRLRRLTIKRNFNNSSVPPIILLHLLASSSPLSVLI